MKKIIIGCFAAVALAAPAQASGGLICRTAGPRPIELALVVSHTVIPAVVSARLTDDGRVVPVATAQSWLDRSEVRIDLTDPNAARHELRLRATNKGDRFDGSLWRNGQRRWVRCREG